MNNSLTIFLHIYYPGSWQIIKEKCRDLFQQSSQIIITGCYTDVLESVDLENAILLQVPNKGKDIGGKLAALQYYLQFGKKTEYLVFMHDKISPQTINADYWLQELFSIFKKENFTEILKWFEKDKGLGIVGSKSFLKNEYLKSSNSFDTSNSNILLELIKKYQLKVKLYNYIAGTVFVVRSSIYEKFFSSFSPLSIRALLEPGNVLDLNNGSVTHSWERLFSFIVEHYNFKVGGY